MDCSVRIWNLKTNLQVGEPLFHNDELFALAISSDGQYIATAGLDKKIYLWCMGVALKRGGDKLAVSVCIVARVFSNRLCVMVTHSDLKLEVKVILASLSFCISLIHQELPPSSRDPRQSIANSPEIIVGGVKGWSTNPIVNSSTEESEEVRRDDLQADVQKVRCHKYRSTTDAHSRQYIGH
jgi:WD40 repeat protein